MSLGVLAAVPVALTAWLAWLYARTFAPTPEVPASVVEAEGGHLLQLPDGRSAEYFEYGSSSPDSAVLV